MPNIISHLQNANQNCNERLLHTHQDGYNEKKQEGCRETGTIIHTKMMQPLCKTVWKFLKRLNVVTELTYDPAIPLLARYPRKMVT